MANKKKSGAKRAKTLPPEKGSKQREEGPGQPPSPQLGQSLGDLTETAEAASQEAPVVVVEGEPSPSASFPIVGIGASAGGLQAFTVLLKALPPDTGMAFVFVQHMDPTHESMLKQLLAKDTAMPVTEVTDGMAVEPNRGYVIPPNTEMTIHRGVLRLVARPGGRGPHTPIDSFLCALAEDQRSKAVGVILSGVGSDGTKGLEAIKAEGGSRSRRTRPPPSTPEWRRMRPRPGVWTLSCPRSESPASWPG